jgi:DNA-binding PadR family transcriptional regulator
VVRPDAGPDGLTATGRVILGMIAFGNRTGYDIKQLVDKSTRHFWAASYGQIYPELRRLELQELVQGRPEPSGGRARTVYELTKAGWQALQRWLSSEDFPVYEVRDESMLKLFFSDLGEPGIALEHVRAMRALQERKRDQLRLLQRKVPEMRPGPRLTLELGLGLTSWLIEWCNEAERRLGSQSEGEV